MLVLIKGAGDLATGTALRLYRAGFSVIMTDLEQPTAVRRSVAFCQCIYDGACAVEGVTARRAAGAEEAGRVLTAGEIPVLAVLQDGSAVLITGFNEQNVVIMDPQTGKVSKKGMNDARTWFAENGNRFIAYW